MTYNAGSFSDLFNTTFGQDLWNFLNEHDNIIRIETATYLHRPALEPLSPYLLERFDSKEIRADRSKQMAGNMVRQIMERLGYRLERKGVKVREGGLFTTAARYTN